MYDFIDTNYLNIESYLFCVFLSLFVLFFLNGVKTKENYEFDYFLKVSNKQLVFLSFVPVINFILALGNLIVFLWARRKISIKNN